MNIPSNLNLNSQNIADCLKTVNNIGNTMYQNVCNGSQTTVPWGSADWALTCVLVAVSLGLVAAVIWMIRS